MKDGGVDHSKVRKVEVLWGKRAPTNCWDVKKLDERNQVGVFGSEADARNRSMITTTIAPGVG